ncbi:MAG: hypothetical protein ACMG6E_07860 [Candidatus Roizmanbacteria bacterium]
MDIEFLKEMDLEDMISDVNKKEKKAPYPKEFEDNSNKNMKEMQEEYDLK